MIEDEIMIRKDFSPKETIERIEHILREMGLEYIITSEINNLDMFFSIRVEIRSNGEIIGTNGKGITRELALASALAELMERLQSRNGMKFWYSTKDYPEKAFVHEYISETNLDESIKADFDEYNDSKMFKYRIDYKEAGNDKVVSFPNRLVNLLCGSNGLCAGNSKAEAIVQGTSEIFERYIQKSISKNHIRCPYICKEELVQYSFYKKMRCFEEIGLKWELLDCSYNNQYPVVGLLVIDRNNMRYAIVLGADVDFEIAVNRCITELLQGRNMENLSISHMKAIDLININDIKIDWDIEKNSNYYDFVDNYVSNNGHHPLYLLSETKKVKVPTVFRYMSNNEEALAYIMSILDDKNLSLYYADFSYLGFPTYRVYIPKLSILFEMKKESFKFIDNIKDNLSLMMRITTLTKEEKKLLITNLIGFSKTYMNRRNAFQSIIFRYYGEKDFDFNFLYLDFVIALLYLSISDYENAAWYYIRFFDERFNHNAQKANELLRTIYIYIIGLAQGQTLEDIRKKYREIMNEKTSQYVFEFIKYDRCLEIVYWPSCPNCESCSYRKECAYHEWKQIDRTLREKQSAFYAM